MALGKKKKKNRGHLTDNQQQQIKKTLKTETPKNYGFSSLFWLPPMITNLIKEQYGIEYKTNNRARILMKESRFSYRKPGHQYDKRDQNVIDAWRQKNKEIFEQYWNDPDAVFLCGDEASISTETLLRATWIDMDLNSKINTSTNRKSKSVYAFIDLKTGIVYAFKTDWQNSEFTCQVLDKLLAKLNKKRAILLWDNATWHRSKRVKQWLSDTTYDIFLVAFPPYSPDLNPQEHVWKRARAKITNNQFIHNIDVFVDKFVHYLNNNLFHYSFQI